MITEHYLINKLANIKTISALCSDHLSSLETVLLLRRVLQLRSFFFQSLHRGQRSTLALSGSKCDVISDIVPGVGGAGSCCIQA